MEASASPKNTIFVGLLTLVTATLYAWVWAINARKQGAKLVGLYVVLVLLLFLVPADIIIQMQFVAKPGFMQPELYGTAALLIAAAAIMCSRQQAKLNDNLESVMHGTVAIPIATQPQPVAAVVPSVAPAVQPAAVPAPVAPASVSGDSWMQGLATIAPTVQAPAAPSPVQPVQPVVPQPQAQAPQVIAPTVIAPTNTQPR